MAKHRKEDKQPSHDKKTKASIPLKGKSSPGVEDTQPIAKHGKRDQKPKHGKGIEDSGSHRRK